MQKVLTLSILFNFPLYYILINFIYACLKIFFKDILYIFDNNLDGLEKVIQYLTTWIYIRSSLMFLTIIWPQIIIVLNKNTVIATHSVLELEKL